jgi:hypothetical protein
MRMIALEKDISESKIGRKRTLHYWIIQLRVVVPFALISPRAEMCEQSEQSELSLLLFPGRAPRWEVVETIFCRRLQESASASVSINSFQFRGKSRICPETLTEAVGSQFPK